MEAWQIITLSLAGVSTIITIGWIGYKAGESIGITKGYQQGWRECQYHHNQKDSLQEAAKKWEFKQHRTN